MRISTSQIYSSTLRQLNRSLNDYTELNLMNSSQKRINAPSDDPIGAAQVVTLRASDDCLAGYMENCAVATDMLSTADATLQEASEMITAALEICEQASTETYTAVQLRAMAIEVREYTDNLYIEANTKLGGNALFAGNDLANDAYEQTLTLTLQDDALEMSDVVAVTGEADMAVWVQFAESGTLGADELDYRYSLDGGQSWTADTVGITSNATLSLDCGSCSVEFQAGAEVTEAEEEGEGAGFLIRSAHAYVGTGRATSLEVAENSSVEVTLVGLDVFGGIDSGTGLAAEEPNLFETLSELAAYLDVGDTESVAECLDRLNLCHEQLLTAATRVGARENRANYAQQDQGQLQELVTASISRREDADATQILVELNQAEYVYEAVLSTTSQILNLNLLNFL